MPYEVGHVNKEGDWDGAYGPYPEYVDAVARLTQLREEPAVEGVTWEIRLKGGDPLDADSLA